MPTDLISRLSARRFPGDNAEVLEFLGWSEISTGTQDGFFSLWRCDDRQEMGLLPLDYLDDALRLVPPDMTVNLRIHANGEATCVLSDDNSYEDGTQLFPTAAHSLVLAILRAKEADRG